MWFRFCLLRGLFAIFLYAGRSSSVQPYGITLVTAGSIKYGRASILLVRSRPCRNSFNTYKPPTAQEHKKNKLTIDGVTEYK